MSIAASGGVLSVRALTTSKWADVETVERQLDSTATGPEKFQRTREELVQRAKDGVAVGQGDWDITLDRAKKEDFHVGCRGSVGRGVIMMWGRGGSRSLHLDLRQFCFEKSVGFEKFRIIFKPPK